MSFFLTKKKKKLFLTSHFGILNKMEEIIFEHEQKFWSYLLTVESLFLGYTVWWGKVGIQSLVFSLEITGEYHLCWPSGGQLQKIMNKRTFLQITPTLQSHQT